MKRAFTALVLVLGLIVPAVALAAGWVVFPSGTLTTAAPSSGPLDTSIYLRYQVTLAAASGTPDGTVTIYTIAPTGDQIAMSTYATPTTAKTFVGECQTKLLINLSGNTTGTVRYVVRVQ